MIKKITMRGIKGANGTQELTGRDIIIGHNGAGKTTRVQSVGISLMGYVPGGGKLTAETAKLASDDTMTVGLDTETFQFSRTFKRDGAKITQSIKLAPANGEKTATDKERRIAAELGKQPVMLDFGEFLNLSDTKRREFIYALAEADEIDLANRDLAERTLRERLALPDTADPKEIEILDAAITECITAYTDSHTLQEGLQAMSDYAKEQTSYWKKERDKATGAAQKMTEYKNDLAETDRTLDANKKRLEELREELITVMGELAKANAHNQNAQEKNARITALQAEIAEIEGATNPNDPAELRELIAQYSADLKQIDNGAATAAAQTALTQLRTEKTDAERQRERELENYHALKAKIDASQALIDKITASNGVCALDCRIQCDKNFTDVLNNLENEKAVSAESISASIEQGKKLKAVIDIAEQGIADTEREIARLQTEEITALRENEELGQLINSLTADLNIAENFDNRKRDRVATKRNELNALVYSAETPMWALIDTVGKTTRRKEIECTERELRTKIDEQTKARNSVASLKNSIIDSVTAGYQADAWKRIAEAVGAKGLQGELVKDTLAPMTDSIQTKLRDMDVHKIFYFQTESNGGKEVFQFGWEELDGERRNFDALSTGEQMLLLIALMTTIIERLNPPLKVLIIDNAENLDHDNLNRVLQGLNTAGANLDNIIFCGVMDLLDITPEEYGWRVWNLNEREQK